MQNESNKYQYSKQNTLYSTTFNETSFKSELVKDLIKKYDKNSSLHSEFENSQVKVSNKSSTINGDYLRVEQ